MLLDLSPDIAPKASVESILLVVNTHRCTPADWVCAAPIDVGPEVSGREVL
jgi:hypothetical protein